MDPEVIKAAAGSPLGVLSLMVLVLSTVALAFFREASSKVKLAVFVLLLAGAAAFAAAVMMKSDVPASAQPRPHPVESTPNVGQIGFVYYGRKDNGDPSDGGKLRPANGAPLPPVSSIRSADVFKSVDVKQLRETASNSSSAIAQMPIGTCYRTIQVTNAKPFTGGEGAWLQVQVVDCPK